MGTFITRARGQLPRLNHTGRLGLPHFLPRLIRLKPSSFQRPTVFLPLSFQVSQPRSANAQEHRYVMMTSVSERRLDDTAPATGVPPSAASSGPTEVERRSQADLFWEI